MNTKTNAAAFFILTLLFSSNVWSQDPFIQEMIATYNANQARFHQKYKNTGLKGIATVTEVKADFLGTGSIFFVGLDVNGSKVRCATQNKDVAASLDAGQAVNFVGTVDDITYDVPALDDCHFSAYVVPVNTIEPPVAEPPSYQEDEADANEVDSPDESVANAPSITSGDRYVYESVYPNNPKSNNKTERIVASVTSKKILLYSKNVASDSIRQLEYTPEWNFLSSKNKDGSGLTYSPPLKYFEFPLKTGDSWSQDSIEKNIKTGKKRKHSISAIVGDWEQITVPAGTFNAIKVTAQTSVIDLETGKPTIGKDVSWYAPEVGRSIKSLLTSTNPDGQQEKQMIQVLEYHPAETPD